LIGQRARQTLEKQFDEKIFLSLWVKVKSGWTDNKAELQRFGF
jgi:GTP-binding protein Era